MDIRRQEMGSSAPSTPLIEFHNVECWRGPTQVFDRFSLEINQGQNVAILGPNGAGKSTLLKLLSREIYPAPGADSHLKILGQSLFETRRYQSRLGLVSHDLQVNFPAAASAREAVLSGFSVSFGVSGVDYSYSPAEQLKADELLDRYEIDPRRQFAHLSTGQQRRCLLARALAPEPETLVLDEPLAGLDPGSAMTMLSHLERLTDSGVCLILATHHVGDILPAVQRVVFLKAGRVVADDQPAKLLTPSRLSDLYGAPVDVLQRDGYWFTVPMAKR